MRLFMERSKLEQFCMKWLNAWTGDKPEELVNYYAKDAYYQDPATPRGLKGQTEILSYFRKLLSKNPDWRWKLEELYPTQNGFILKWKAEIPVGDEIINAVGMDIVELSKDKITRNEVYFDRTLMLDKLHQLKGN